MGRGVLSLCLVMEAMKICYFDGGMGTILLVCSNKHSCPYRLV